MQGICNDYAYNFRLKADSDISSKSVGGWGWGQIRFEDVQKGWRLVEHKIRANVLKLTKANLKWP